MDENEDQDWAIEEHPDDPEMRWLCVWDRGFIDGPNFWSAEHVEQFIEELRAASRRVFGPDVSERSSSNWHRLNGS